MPNTVQQSEVAATRRALPTSLLTISDEHYRALAKSAKVISFDVFDTLIHRQVVNPGDIFAIVGRKAGLPGFAEQRMAAEARARRSARPATFEVSLDQIYAAFPADFLSDAEGIKQLELETECEFIFANDTQRRAIERLRADGFRVVAITDIYLTKDQVELLLTANGITVDAIYSSCDYRDRNLGKYNGDIFPIVCAAENIQPHELLHAGDHPNSDVSQALNRGVVAVQTDHPNAHLINRSESFAAIKAEHSNLSSSIIAGTIAKAKLRDTAHLVTSVQNYAYDFGGPLLVGMVAHLLKCCKERGIEHLVLLARDGCVVRDVLDILKPEGLTYRVIPASRRLAVFPAYASGGLDKIKSLFAGNKRISKRQILAILRLEHLADGLVDPDQQMELKAAIEEMHSLLRKQAENERAALLEYLGPEMEMLEAGKTFAWVDVGWALSSPTRLNELLGHDIPGFFIGSHGDANPYEGFDGYLFARGRPHSLAKVVMRSVEIIELIFADWAPSAAFLKNGAQGIETVHYDKSPAETVRDAHIRAARSGVLKFAEDIRPAFGLIDADELREYNRKIYARICSDPPVALYKLLAAVPHDAMAGTLNWRTIGDLWLPNFSYVSPDRKLFSSALSYRKSYMRRYLKWHLPPSVWRLLSRASNIVRKYL